MKERAINGEWQDAIGGLGVVAAAAAFSALICVLAQPICTRLGVLDAPDGRRKLHPVTTPLAGGLAIGLPTVAALFMTGSMSIFLPLYFVVAFAGVGCLLLGLLDDRAHIRPTYRLFLSLLLALAVLEIVPALRVTFLRFSFLDQVAFLEQFALVFTAICIVGLQNAINMADGKNGVVMGLCLFWCVELLLFAPDSMRPVLLALGGALVVTLAFNLRGRLFLGDSGSYSLSFIIALLVIYVYDVTFTTLPADLVALWFLIPVVDCLRVMALRVTRGQSPLASDRSHLHHILYNRLPWRWGLTVYMGLAGLPGLLASFAPGTTLAWGIAALCCYGVIVAWPDRGRQTTGNTAK
ncbi:MAG: undecaprenyl/decaprenyl-phosphate alpha-N-acetylglucosaminyl 1-phosphate transferase [Rhodospirillaceae bacterium]|nr:undecaprenyl/decaprenyl-phosphate alpha-N-acetylglucosaminyl 1-phosphate transferase [Rhodospirillaceae bacterium]MBT4691241.1 undecaprenyl/decaprenyl-phosphate alpha-N-acetylglucosaminyl 1-phosphate transferase [Rhodospirillaceae bacterium]MBT5082528.1 undecaprenyl/decaprenyl-phosphate alpha-N-acetylglucosaminyl 1-phosphate transferase [Rhodospirillaceae bacterium]MBT5525403.1 undecaprenyl/decaprenyl-phosphate alpha-N-acetylglucosaminyl 1-phosphate transferase [Rhodospirillaceae bacterium]M